MTLPITEPNRHYTIAVHIDPASHIRELTPPGVDPHDMMQDFNVVRHTDSGLVLAVGDMANNGPLTPTHVDQEFAADINIASSHRFNGGHIGRRVLERLMQQTDAQGSELLALANEALCKKYIELGLIKYPEDVESIRPEDRCTGYVAHAKVGPEKTTLTSVEDTYIYVNGELVCGQEKKSELLKQELIESLTALIAANIDQDTLSARVADTVGWYADCAGLPPGIAQRFAAALWEGIKSQPLAERNKQTVYVPVRDHVSPWQVNALQNNAFSSQGYAAIDGTHTIAQGVFMREVPTAEIHTLVLTTDGLKAKCDSVRQLQDLSPINPQFSEQTAIAVKFA